MPNISQSKPKSVEITLDKDAGGISQNPKNMTSRLTDVENLTKAILWVGIISVVGVVVTCSVLVIDQMHFNNQTYKDQSDKTDLQNEKTMLEIQALKTQLNNVKNDIEKSSEEKEAVTN